MWLMTNWIVRQCGRAYPTAAWNGASDICHKATTASDIALWSCSVVHAGCACEPDTPSILGLLCSDL